VTDAVVTRERAATFRAAPGSRALRPPEQTCIGGLFLAGAWCDTGWPATMEGAVRSGAKAAAGAVALLSGSERRGATTAHDRRPPDALPAGEMSGVLERVHLEEATT